MQLNHWLPKLGDGQFLLKEASPFYRRDDELLVAYWLNTLCCHLNANGWKFIPVSLDIEYSSPLDYLVISHPPKKRKRRSSFLESSEPFVIKEIPYKMSFMIGVNLPTETVLVSCGRGGWEYEFPLGHPQCDEMIELYLNSFMKLATALKWDLDPVEEEDNLGNE